MQLLRRATPNAHSTLPSCSPYSTLQKTEKLACVGVQASCLYALDWSHNLPWSDAASDSLQSWCRCPSRTVPSASVTLTHRGSRHIARRELFAMPAMVSTPPVCTSSWLATISLCPILDQLSMTLTPEPCRIPHLLGGILRPSRSVSSSGLNGPLRQLFATSSGVILETPASTSRSPDVPKVRAICFGADGAVLHKSEGLEIAGHSTAGNVSAERHPLMGSQKPWRPPASGKSAASNITEHEQRLTFDGSPGIGVRGFLESGFLGLQCMRWLAPVVQGLIPVLHDSFRGAGEDNREGPEYSVFCKRGVKRVIKLACTLYKLKWQPRDADIGLPGSGAFLTVVPPHIPLLHLLEGQNLGIFW